MSRRQYPAVFVLVALLQVTAVSANTNAADPSIATEDGNVVVQSGDDAFVVMGGVRHSLAGVVDSIRTLSSRVTALEERISSQKETIDAQAKTIASQADEIARLEGGVFNNSQRITSNANLISSQGNSITSLSSTTAGLGSQLGNLKGSVASVRETASSLGSQLSSLQPVANGNQEEIASLKTSISAFDKFVGSNEVIDILPWTNRPGRYQLRGLFDSHRRAGLTPHTYRCFVRTNNGAHWKGATFTIIANYYVQTHHSGYPHRIYDVTHLNAGSSGCSAGLSNFVVNGNTGYFDFSPGNCKQRVTMTCREFI